MEPTYEGLKLPHPRPIELVLGRPLEPTYEGLKLLGRERGIARIPEALEPTYEGLKLWDHRASWEGHPPLEPTYEGLKLGGAVQHAQQLKTFGAYL